MIRKTLRNILWTIAGVFAIYCIAKGAIHHLATASLIFVLGAVQDEED